MVQTFGILGFVLSLLALFFASEVMRRAAHRTQQLEAALFKATTRIQKLENSTYHVEKLATELRTQRKRQAETLTALANKGAQKGEAAPETGERFTPTSHAQHTAKKAG